MVNTHLFWHYIIVLFQVHTTQSFKKFLEQFPNIDQCLTLLFASYLHKTKLTNSPHSRLLTYILVNTDGYMFILKQSKLFEKLRNSNKKQWIIFQSNKYIPTWFSKKWNFEFNYKQLNLTFDFVFRDFKCLRKMKKTEKNITI